MKQMMKRAVLLLIGMLALLLASCGGSGSHAPANGRFALTVLWPEASRLIPAASTSIKAVLTRGETNLGEKLLVRPAEAPWTTTVTFEDLPPGDVTLTATAFPRAEGSGVAQATGAAPVTIVAGQTAQVTVTMASTIDHLTITPANPSVNVGANVALTMTAYDAQNNVVLVAPANVRWTSAAQGTATVDNAGNATGVAVGTAQVTVLESESTKSANTTVTVNTTAGSGGCTPETVVGPGGLASSGWPKAGADVRNTGRGQGSGATGQLKWSVAVGSESSGFQVTIGPDGTIYHTTYDGRLVARNPSDGSVKWTFTADTGGIQAIPTVGRNGLVYITADSLYAVDAQTGAMRWRWPEPPLRGGLDTTPTIGADGTVYAGTRAFPNGRIRAFDGETGAQKWDNFDLAVSGRHFPPAIGADGALFVPTPTGLYAVDGVSGCVRWFKRVGLVGGTAIGDDGTVYATVQPQQTNIPPTQVVAVDPANGNIKWTANNVPGQETPPAIGPDGTIYVLGDPGITALNPATGAVKWTFAKRNGLRASPAIGGDGTVYFLGTSAPDSNKVPVTTLFALDPATGAQKWTYTVPYEETALLAGPTDATPTIGPDGTIYVCTFGGDSLGATLYAIK